MYVYIQREGERQTDRHTDKHIKDSHSRKNPCFQLIEWGASACQGQCLFCVKYDCNSNRCCNQLRKLLHISIHPGHYHRTHTSFTILPSAKSAV